MLLAGAVFGSSGCSPRWGSAARPRRLRIDPASATPDWLAARVVLAMALWAAVGVGVGSLIQNQIAAVVVVIAFTQFVEPIPADRRRLLGSLRRRSPGSCPGPSSDALVGASTY